MRWIKGFNFIAGNIPIKVGNIDDDEGLAIIKLLKSSPLSNDQQSTLIGFIDNRVAVDVPGESSGDSGKEKAKDAPLHDFYREADWLLVGDKDRALLSKLVKMAMFIKEMGDPKLSEPCIAKFLTIIAHMDKPDATYTVDERLERLQIFKSYMATAMPVCSGRVVDMPTTPEEFNVMHPLWYASLYRDEGSCPVET